MKGKSPEKISGKCDWCERGFSIGLDKKRIEKRYLSNLVVCRSCARRYARNNTFEYCPCSSFLTLEEKKERHILSRERAKANYRARKYLIHQRTKMILAMNVDDLIDLVRNNKELERAQ